MTSQRKPSTDEPPETDPAADASARATIQAALPEITSALIALAKSGSVPAIKLAFELADADLTLTAALARALRSADPDVLDDLQLILADTDLLR